MPDVTITVVDSAAGKKFNLDPDPVEVKRRKSDPDHWEVLNFQNDSGFPVTIAFKKPDDGRRMAKRGTTAVPDKRRTGAWLDDDAKGRHRYTVSQVKKRTTKRNPDTDIQSTDADINLVAEPTDLGGDG